MISLSIAPEFRAKIPAVAVGCLSASCRNSEHNEGLWQEIEAAMIRLETTRIQMVVISFLEAERMDAVLRRAAGLFERYAAASGIETAIVA